MALPRPSSVGAMAKDEEKPAKSAPAGGRRLGTPLGVTLVLLALLGTAYYAYYRRQAAYLTGRNLRILSLLTAQTEGQIQGTVDIAALNRQAPPSPLALLGETLPQIVARRFGTAFDVIIVADAGGKVLAMTQPPASSSSLLYRDDDPDDPDAAAAAASGIASTRSPLVITNLGVLAEKSGWAGEAKPLDPARLAKATAHATVVFDGAEYRLFAQPFARQPWIVCGLVSASTFRYDAMAVSATLVLAATALALLAVCCWPFLRIALTHRSQALTIGDVVLVAICTIVGAAVLTLALDDAIAYASFSASADKQLERFGATFDRDFGQNVGRAMTVLARVQGLTAALPPGSIPLPRSIADDPIVGRYPYIDTVSWIDPAGEQRVKLRNGDAAPLVRVADRRYFRDALANRTWTAGGQRYVLEWVQSRTTGATTAVLARNTGNPALPVIAMATELVDVTHGVRPPGVEVAVIDEGGAVVYHSDNQRIGYENFFAEADRNRELRSAVVARRAGLVTAQYWGEDTAMYVRPLTGSPWTLVAFRAKRLTRVLNVEGALLTLFMLLLNALPYLITFILVLVLAPGYRAPRLWPDAARGPDYLRLSLILLALLVLFWANDYVLTPWSAYFGEVFLPLIALLSTYLVLHRVGAPWRFRMASALWLILFALYLGMWVIPQADVDAGLFFLSDHPVATKVALVALAVGVAGWTMLLLSGRSFLSSFLSRAATRLGYAALYRLCGVLLLVVGVIMPTTGFFTISRHVESELLRKYGQLRAAADLEHRIERIERMNVAGGNSPDVLRDISTPQLHDAGDPEKGSNAFVRTWELVPPPLGLAAQPVEGPECKTSNTEDWTVPGSAAKWLPSLYEDSVAIRPLFEARAADDLWFWCLRDRYVKLVRKVRFDSGTAAKLWHASPSEQRIVLLSVVPQGAADWQRHALLLLLALPLLALFWYAADFIAARVLLIDLEAPRWMSGLPLTPTLGDHVFLVRRDRDVGPLATGFCDVSLAQLDQANGWDAKLVELDGSQAGRNVHVVDFEYGIHDDAVNDRKLAWLERLLALPDRRVVMVSAISMVYVTVVAGNAERWRALLDRFVCVTVEELELRKGVTANWLEHETEYNSFLQILRRQLDPKEPQRRLMDEISERAEAYYAALWSSFRADEKLLLYHLARNGLANARNRRVLRRLMARGIVRRDPNLELFSETFRLYVLDAAKDEKLADRARQERPPSTWDALRIPFFVVIVSFLLLLFATQKDLLTTTTTLATILTTGVPLLMKLLGVFTEQRLDAGK